MRGFWTLADYAAYIADFRAIASPLFAGNRWFGIVVDNTEFGVQSAEVSDALIKSINSGRVEKRAPAALIVKGSLSRMQAQRIGAGAHVRIVGTRREALDWMQANAPPGWVRPA